MPCFATGRGVGVNMSEEEDEVEEAICRYFHIQACAPGGIADADGGFAERIFAAAQKYSKKRGGSISIPSNWLATSWKPGEVHTSGGADYTLPFVWPPGSTPVQPQGQL